MFSECEDDLCIFVCGTCKRYFTQLSAFSQHKKEKSCKKKSPGGVLLKDSAVRQPSTQDTSEENDADENVAETTSNLSETLNDAEDNSQRKYPRKQDKKLIKRTIRELENENLLSPEGKVNVSSLYTPRSQDLSADNTLALMSPEMQRSCKHPVYVCKTCHAEFPNTNGRVFKCVDCRRGFYTEADLNQHMVRAKHNNLCAVCGKIFPDKYKLRKHELSHVTEKNFRCEEPGCTKSFKSAEDVRTHVRYVHAVEKRFHCTQCSKAFTRLDKFKLHMNTHGISLKPGPVSPTHTSTLGSNPLALKSSPGDETPGALVLYHSTSNESGVDVTEVVQTVEVAAGDVNSHPSPGHGHNSVSSEVDVVGKSDTLEEGGTVVSYSSSNKFTNSVNNYEKSADGQSSESLDSSGKSQSEAGQECLRCHTRFHTSIEFLAHEERRPDHVLRCDNCSGKYLSFCELRSHVTEEHGVQFLPQIETKPPQETPKKQRKHFCQECGKGFTRPDKLKRHTIIHSPNRPCIPCVCKESHGCERTFYRNDSMKRHALTHTLDKPYTCEECGKNFSRPDYLTKHVGHVHKRAFKHLCTLCDYGTREAKRLKIHIRSKHELDPDLFLSTDGSESTLGPSMANPGETATPNTAESPVDRQSPREIVQPTRELTSPNEQMNACISRINPGESDPTKINPGEFSPREMNTGEMTPQDLTSGEINPSPSDMDSREFVQHTGQMTPNSGHLTSNIGETTPNIEATNSAVIEPLTNDLSPAEMHQHGMDIDRHSRDVSPPPEEIHQATGEIDPGDRYQRSGIEIPGTLSSPRGSESPSPVTRQSVISQDLGVPELRLLPDFQDVPRHNFNDRRSAEYLGDQSVRSRFPYAYPPQDMRPQYSMPADFAALGHQTGLTQFPPHQSVFSNVHMQFPGGAGHLPNYERKTPLNSRPVAQSPYNWRS